ncbi:MAG: tetraacyldisaccharide 4'-kinase [Candidatus Omnitrophica bacterium]|nr:tetraacyldisaccharide 4'-kinase [Candidatus Omnitrophota bacterium]
MLKYLVMLLAPFEWIYRGIWFFWDQGYRNGFFLTHQVFPKVISVGNLTWGGTGKTPLVAYLAKRLQANGQKAAVLSRGYGSPQNRQQADEVVALKKTLEGIGFFASPDRVHSARQAQREGYGVVLLDDGFQHRRLVRHLDIVAIDATDPFGNGRLIPAGKLREPVHSLKRADWIILTKVDLVSDGEISRIKEKIQKITPNIPIGETFYRSVGLSDVGAGFKPAPTLDGLKDRDVGLVAAIGNPEAFHRTVEKLGAKVTRTYFKRDHSRYAVGDFQKMEEIQKRDSLFCWVTTSKDAVKMEDVFGDCPRFLGTVPVFSLEIELVFKKGERELWRVIESL